MRVNRSVTVCRATSSFIPARVLAHAGLAGCNTASPWHSTSPVFQAPHGAPFGPSSGFHGSAPSPFLLAPSADFCHALEAGCPASSHAASFDAPTTRQISRGKTRHLHCISAGFTKCTPAADGGLRGQRPTRPGCITPHIRFLFIAPQFRIGLPPHPASRRRTCPSPCLRLCENLATGLSPAK